MAQSSKTPKIYKVKDVKDNDKFIDIHENLPQMPSLCLIIGSVRSGKCLYEESIVQTHNGLKRIRDVKIGEYVNSMNEYVKVLDVIKQGIKSTYQIKLTNGSKLILTDDHKLQTTDGMKPLRECNEKYIVTRFGQFKISSKKYYGEVMTYDLSVDHDDHTFLCNDISVSNSNLLVNFFCNPDMYKGKFDTVKIISTTLNSDTKGKILSKYFDCDDHYSDGLIDSIKKEQSQYDKEDRPTYALVLDDVLTKDFSKNNAVSFFSTRFRHYIDFYVIATQSFRAVSGMIRNNATDVIIARQQNQKELLKIAEEYGDLVGGGDNFIELYNEIHNKPYMLMYLKLSENPAQVYRNFEEKLYPK